MICTGCSHWWRPSHSSVIAILAVIVLGSAAHAADWPQWRGPRRNGQLTEPGYPTRLVAGQARLLWEANIAAGYSAPSVAQGKVIVTDYVRDKAVERVLCFDAQRGDLLWMHQYPCRYVDIQYDNGPRAAPTIVDNQVFTLGTMGHFRCLELTTGKLLWQVDLQTAYQARVPIWGLASAPLVYRDLVIVNAGGLPEACLVAFHRNSGKERWRALADDPGYSAPILVRRGQNDLLVFWSADAVVGLDPATGRTWWRIPFRTRMDLAVATPVVQGDLLFVSAFYDGSLMIQLSEDGRSARVLWRRKGRSERNTDALHCLISTPRFDPHYIYGVDSYGALRCLNAANGDRLWQTYQPTGRARWSNAHLIAYGRYTYLFNEHGELIVARLTPEGYEERGRVKLIEPTEGVPYLRPVSWAHPAFADGKLYVRNDRLIRCYELARTAR